MAQRVPIDPDKGLTDLLGQLSADSKRLVRDEIRLAKLETSASMREAGKGGMWLGVAFGAAVIALVAATILLVTFFGRIANGHMWVGAFLTAAIEVAAGLWLLQRGSAELKRAPYSLPDTREGLKLLRR